MDMEDMIFYSLDELNHVLIEKINAENKRPFDGLSYSRFETNLRLSSLINKGALVENLKTGNGRVYNDATV